MAALGKALPLPALPEADNNTRDAMDVEVAAIVSQKDFGTIFAVEGTNARPFKVLVPSKIISAMAWSLSCRCTKLVC